MPGVTTDTLTGLATDMSRVTGTSRATARGGRSRGRRTTDRRDTMAFGAVSGSPNLSFVRSLPFARSSTPNTRQKLTPSGRSSHPRFPANLCLDRDAHKPLPSAPSRRTNSVCMTWLAMFGSGSRIAYMRTRYVPPSARQCRVTLRKLRVRNFRPTSLMTCSSSPGLSFAATSSMLRSWSSRTAAMTSLDTASAAAPPHRLRRKNDTETIRHAQEDIPPAPKMHQQAVAKRTECGCALLNPMDVQGGRS